MAKVDPYLRPLFDALHDMIDAERVAAHLERGVIEVAPLAFMRGRTLNDSFVILDEAQNTTPRADEDVPDPPRLRLEDGRHRRHHAGRPAARPEVGPGRRRGHPRRASRASSSSASAARTSCATSSCSGSSPPTTSTPQRAAPELRPAPTRRRPEPVLDVEVIGSSALPEEVAAGPCAIALAAAGVEDGHVAVEFVDAERIAELNRAHRGDRGADRRALLPGRRGRSCRARPALRELGDVVICPEHTEDLSEAVVHGMLHLTGMDHETDERRDARAAGRDRVAGCDDAARASSRWRGGRTSASRRWSTRSSARRSRSSPTSRRPRGARSAASRRTRRAPTRGSSC